MHCFVELQICGFLKDGATEVWNQAQDVPYAYKGNQWVGYDNEKSFQIKVRKQFNAISKLQYSMSIGRQ